MKKLLLLLTFISISLSGFGQFALTPQGLVNIENPKNNYIVLEFEGKSQQDLFNAVNVYLHSVYVNPQNVVSAVENKAITISGISKEAIITKDKNILVKHPLYDIRYTIALEFKDGKIKVNAPHIISIERKAAIPGKYNLVGSASMEKSVFNKKGKVLDDKGKESIENFFSTYIANIKNYIDDSDW